jgi:hypothetical protein
MAFIFFTRPKYSPMRTALYVAIISIGCSAASVATAQDDHMGPNSPASKITPIYGPAREALQPIRDMLITAKVLEKLQQFLTPLRLKDNITVQTSECGPPTQGRHYSFIPYESGKPVTVCYELVQLMVRMAPPEYDVLGHALVTREMAIEGPFVQEVLHDVVLAVFDQLQVPVWGNIDDAADNVAALSMMYFGSSVALKAILGSANFLQKIDQSITDQKDKRGHVTGYSYDAAYLSDIRAPMLQRYYNLLCMALGKDPVLFSTLIALPPRPPTDLEFSWDKAQHCRGVYLEAADGFKQTILDKYVDHVLLDQIKTVDWFATP